MIKPVIAEALKIINKKLNNPRIKWVIVGSTSLALQGVQIRPKDIDIHTDKKEIFEINRLLKEYQVNPIKFRRSEIFESYIGDFKINGVKVEVMADLKRRIGDKWVPVSGQAHPQIIKVEGMQIPVFPLHVEMKSYERLGRKKDAVKIQKIKAALRFDEIIRILRTEYKRFRPPAVTQISWRRDPFQILISCILSLRTKDDVTTMASERLFRLAKTPSGMLKLGVGEIEKVIYPAGFYRTKARRILGISEYLVKNCSSVVPDSIEELLKMKGVGRKTANLVVTLGYGKPGICVDTHVHRISNRLGYVHTKKPLQTEMALRKKLPEKYWLEYNDLLVAFGQNVCTPLSPKCSLCAICRYCKRVGVKRAR